MGIGGAPSRWGRRASRDVGGDLGTEELPDGDGFWEILHGNDAAVLVVPAGAEGVVQPLHDAADIAFCGRRAVEIGELSKHIHAGRVGHRGVAEISHLEVGASMKGVFVGRCKVDVFEEINLTSLRPVGTDHPERAPHSTGGPRMMADVCDPQS